MKLRINFMAFIRGYSRDGIGILVVSTRGWLLCKKISEISGPILAIRQIVQKSKRIFHDEVPVTLMRVIDRWSKRRFRHDGLDFASTGIWIEKYRGFVD